MSKTLLVLAIIFPVVDIASRLNAPADALWFAVWYRAPLCLVAPLWARARLADWFPARGRIMWLDGAVVLVSLMRVTQYADLLPLSGHMLFLTYTFLTTRQFHYRVIAAVIWLETTYLKWVAWHDYVTWGCGLILGIVAWLVFRRWHPRKVSSPL